MMITENRHNYKTRNIDNRRIREPIVCAKNECVDFNIIKFILKLLGKLLLFQLLPKNNIRNAQYRHLAPKALGSSGVLSSSHFEGNYLLILRYLFNRSDDLGAFYEWPTNYSSLA